MESIKVHVSQDNYISISCPSCEKYYRISVAKYKKTRHTVVIRCKCEKRFEVHLNFRSFYRKSVDLVGDFKNLSSGTEEWILMNVINLSMSGIGFTTVGTTGINKDDTLRVKFTLDNKSADLIDKEVVVRDVGKWQYGCEFIDLAYEEKGLGFYLFSK